MGFTEQLAIFPQKSGNDFQNVLHSSSVYCWCCVVFWFGFNEKLQKSCEMFWRIINLWGREGVSKYLKGTLKCAIKKKKKNHLNYPQADDTITTSEQILLLAYVLLIQWDRKSEPKDRKSEEYLQYVSSSNTKIIIHRAECTSLQLQSPEMLSLILWHVRCS